MSRSDMLVSKNVRIPRWKADKAREFNSQLKAKLEILEYIEFKLSKSKHDRLLDRWSDLSMTIDSICKDNSANGVRFGKQFYTYKDYSVVVKDAALMLVLGFAKYEQLTMNLNKEEYEFLIEDYEEEIQAAIPAFDVLSICSAFKLNFLLFDWIYNERLPEDIPVYRALLFIVISFPKESLDDFAELPTSYLAKIASLS